MECVGYSVAGFSAAYKHEDAFRQEVLLAVILIPLALWLPVGYIGKALMIGSVLLVIMVELFNSAIEATVDRISLESHDLSKRTKDIGSLAVLVSTDQRDCGMDIGFDGVNIENFIARRTANFIQQIVAYSLFNNNKHIKHLI